MPIETNLPVKVNLYLELIGLLNDQLEGHDSNSGEAELYYGEIRKYLAKIEKIMDDLQEDGDME